MSPLDWPAVLDRGPGGLDAAGLGALAPLAELSAEDRDVLASAARISVPARTMIFSPGDRCTGFVLVLAGSVRVTRITEEGRELVLYRIGPGESCILTTACLLAREDHAAEAVAETDVEALQLAAADFQLLMDRARPFRDFVFTTFGTRLVGLTNLLEGIAYERVDVRLARLLLERAGEASVVTTTHQQLANELGSAREVVSRRLEDFAARGWVELGRGRVMLAERDGLADLAGG